MRRCIAGGCLMGFGGVPAGGRPGVSGASVFAVTVWIVLWPMRIGAVLTARLRDQKKIRVSGRSPAWKAAVFSVLAMGAGRPRSDGGHDCNCDRDRKCAADRSLLDAKPGAESRETRGESPERRL
jgi:hypothetical protein